MRPWIYLFSLFVLLVCSQNVAAASTSQLLATFEEKSEFFFWTARDGGRAIVEEGPTTDGSHYVRFDYIARPGGWPAFLIQGPSVGLPVTDWSSYDYMTIDLYNAGSQSNTMLMRLDDKAAKRYNRSVQLPPHEWVRWVVPVREINIDKSTITAAHFFYDQPGAPGTVYIDNWRLWKGAVEPLIPPAAKAERAAVEEYSGPPEYRLAVVDTMTKVRIDAPYEGELIEAASIAAARNEAEGFQILVMPRGGLDLQQVTLTATPLERQGGSGSIAASQVEFHQVGYVKTTWPYYSVDRAGWWPDPLLNPASFAVKNNDVQPVWVTVHVPEGTPAGIYNGSIKVTPVNAAPRTVPVQLRVYDFSVPREGSLPLAFTYFEDLAIRMYGANVWWEKGLQKKFYDLILSYRLAPDNIYRSIPPLVDDVAYWNERGLTAFNITQVGSKAKYTDNEINSILDKIERALQDYKEAGLDQKAYVYGFDEIGPSVYPGLQQMWGAVGERFPGLKRLVAAEINPAGYGYVDAWANTVETYKPELAEQRRAAGDEVWLYLSMSGRHPYPNWFIEYPAIEARLVWWMGYLYNIDGFLYYAINHHMSKIPTPIDVNAGPYTDWDPASFVTPGGEKFNGDGLLIYAGQDGPLASIRLANIRDGLEDYEYLHLLQNRLVETGKATDKADAAAQVQKLISNVVSGLTTYTEDPATLRKVRNTIAEAIEGLQ